MSQEMIDKYRGRQMSQEMIDKYRGRQMSQEIIDIYIEADRCHRR